MPEPGSKHARMRHLLCAFLLCACSLTSSLSDELDDARAAYQAGAFDEAIALLMPLAETGHAEAQYAVALCYAQGQGVGQDEAESLKWLRSSAENGFAEAQYALGQIFLEGEGVEASEQEARRWFELAAAQGHDEAEFMLRGYTRFDMSYDEVRKSAEEGDDTARLLLGIMYLNGELVKQDFGEAERWLRASFEDPWSSVHEGKIALAIMYHNGLGVAQDYVQACYLFEDAANLGNPFDVYNFEKEPISLLTARPDLNASVAWFEKAAREGHTGAQFCLAVAHYRGLVVEKNLRQVIHWLEKSAAGGDARAQYYLGNMYAGGEGVAENEKKAAHWFEQAAQQEHADAQAMLGVCYFYGSGVEKDIEKTRYWLRKAIENGDTEAAEFWGWFELGEFEPGRIAGKFEHGVYTAYAGLFKAPYRLRGANERDPCCDETVSDFYDPEGRFGILSMSNEYGALNGVIFGPAEAHDDRPGDGGNSLQRWFRTVVMDVLGSGGHEPVVLREERRRFHGMPAWVAAVSIPEGGVIEHYSSATGRRARLDSVRGFVVFQREDFIYALMCEMNVLSFTGEGRVYDPDDWDSFVNELSALYAAMEFGPG